jgi:hypothetical protein
MAGLYADIPGTLFALDQDGSVVKWRNYTLATSWTDITGSIAEALKVNTANFINLLSPGNAQSEYVQVSVAFPEARDVNGIYTHLGVADGGQTGINYAWDYSMDTSDGTDGTWTPFTVTYSSLGQHDQSSDVSKPYYRSDIASVALTNVKGLRVRYNCTYPWSMTYRMYVFHIYGNRPIIGVDRLSFWNPSSDQALGAAYLDFGDIAQGSSVTRQFRIKNLSSTLTANGITVDVSDIQPEYSGTGIQLSTDNTTFQSSITIGNLAPGAISAILYVRRSVPVSETPSQRNARLLANATTWS